MLPIITQGIKNVVQLTAILAGKSRRDDSEILGDVYINLIAYQGELGAQWQTNRDQAFWTL